MGSPVRRPLFFVALASASSILIARGMGVLPWAAGLVLMGIWVGLKRKDRKEWRDPDTRRERTLLLALIMAGYFLCGLHMILQELEQSQLAEYEDRTVRIQGIVKTMERRESPEGEPRIRLTVAADKVDDRSIPKEKILVTAEDKAPETYDDSPGEEGDCLLPGDRIKFSGTLRCPSPKRNPGCFDYRLHLRTKGIHTTLYTESIRVVPRSLSLKTKITQCIWKKKEIYFNRLEQRTDPQTAAMMRGILFGETGEMDEEILETFRRNGTAHILAVSGLHIGILYGTILTLWKLLGAGFPGISRGRGRTAFFLLMILFFAAYAMVSSWSPSVVRAVVMVILHAFGEMTGRRYDLTSAAYGVALGCLIIDPLILLQLGFQMSFLAVLTLSMLYPWIERSYSGVFLASLAAQIGLGPYIIYRFNTFNLVAVLLNVPVVFFAGIIVPAGVLSLILPPAGILLDEPSAILCQMMIRLNDLGRIDGVTAHLIPSPPLGVLLLFYGGLLAFGSEEGRLWIHRGTKRQVTAGLLCLCMGAALIQVASDDGFRRMDGIFVDVGQGDCFHLRTGGKNYLFDGGGSDTTNVGRRTLRPYLLANGVGKVDGALVTHLHTDHYRGICELAREGMVERLFLYEGNRLREEEICRETCLDPGQLIYLRRGHRVNLSQGASFTILWPEGKNDKEYARLLADEEDENGSSLIVRVEAEGVSILVTGDLGEEGERQLMDESSSSKGRGSREDPLRADVLKVGHHGSRSSTSEGFLDQVNPKIAVISVGKNNLYGHPTPEVLTRFSARGIPLFRTDLSGAIGLDLEKGKIRQVRRMIRE